MTVSQTLINMDFPTHYGLKIRRNNVIAWMNSEIRRRTQVVEVFSDGSSTLMLRSTLGSVCGDKGVDCQAYLCMKSLDECENEAERS